MKTCLLLLLCISLVACQTDTAYVKGPDGTTYAVNLGVVGTDSAYDKVEAHIGPIHLKRETVNRNQSKVVSDFMKFKLWEAGLEGAGNLVEEGVETFAPQ